MKIIISPAKKMIEDTESFEWKNLPACIQKTEQLCSVLQAMSFDDLKKLWKCNDAITDLNAGRMRNMDLYSQLTPAILAYEGIQYQYMAPGVFLDEEFKYIEEHLRIISGFYGILRPFDGVKPYRLEMQAKLRIGENKDLYSYWGNTLADILFSETDCIINLASKEYSLCISKYLPENYRFITCVFGEEKNGKVIEKGTLCKMARGEMVRFLAEQHVNDPERVKEFNRLNYQFQSTLSDDDRYVFLRKVTEN